MAFYKIYIHILALILATGLWLIKWKKKVIQNNLKLCKITEFSRFKFYLNLSRDLISFLHHTYPGALRLHPKSRENFANFKKSGGILLCAHYHHWELMGAWFTKNKLPVLGYAQPLKNKFMERLLTYLRKKIKLPTVSNNVPHTALNWIAKKGVFGVLLDQHYPSASNPSEFFSQRVYQSSLPWVLLKKSQKPVYFAVLSPNSTIRLLTVCSNEKLSKSELMARYHKYLELIIRSQPEYWYGWAHRRFKQPKLRNSKWITIEAKKEVRKEVRKEGIVSRETLDLPSNPKLFHVKQSPQKV